LLCLDADQSPEPDRRSPCIGMRSRAAGVVSSFEPTFGLLDAIRSVRSRSGWPPSILGQIELRYPAMVDDTRALFQLA
jgi:hypothetical protein